MVFLLANAAVIVYGIAVVGVVFLISRLMTRLVLKAYDRFKQGRLAKDPAPIAERVPEAWHRLLAAVFDPVELLIADIEPAVHHVDIALEPADRLAISDTPICEIDRRLTVLRTGLRFAGFTDTGIRLEAVDC